MKNPTADMMVDVKDLYVSFRTDNTTKVRAVNGVDLALRRGGRLLFSGLRLELPAGRAAA